MCFTYQKPTLIDEIGCNHQGKVELAFELIRKAKQAGANIAKFQKRNLDFWSKIKPEIYFNPHPNPANSFGNTYLEHRKNLEFDFKTHLILKQYCEELGIEYSASVWDLYSAQEIASLNPKCIKIPSACNTNFQILEWLCKNYSGKIHISTGMIDFKTVSKIVDFFKKEKRIGDLVLYHCISIYPTFPHQSYLLEIKNLKEAFSDYIFDIGFSGHHIGITLDIAAYILGANFIERHFTIDKNLRGTDHAISLTPDEFKTLRENLFKVYNSLKFINNTLLPDEEKEKEKLKYIPIS
jgi:sialic acid synthase